MFNNNYKSDLLAVSIASALLTLSYSTTSLAEINPTGGVFLYGDNIQVGINKHAAFGTDGEYSTKAPYTQRSEEIGLLSDPSGDMFTSNSYDGDFFMSGVKEAGWGIRLEGVDYHNTRNKQDFIDPPLANITNGVFSDFKDLENTQEVTWTGKIANKLEVRKYFSLYKKGLTAVIDVEIKNITNAVMTDVYYMHTLDPDNNFRINNNLKTVNTIISQGSEKGVAVVSAKQVREVDSDKGESELKLIGYAKNAHVSFGGRYNRNAEAVYNGEDGLSISGTSGSEDVSISLAYKFDEIAAGETVKFKVGLQLANTDIPELTLDDDNSSKAVTDNAYKTLYIAKGEAKSVVDSDLKITLHGQDKIQGAEISLSNPYDNDLIDLLAGSSLPTGITKDLVKSTANKLVLTGEATVEDYETVLKQVGYSNTNTSPSLDERIINILILDNIFTLSNAAQAYIGVVMPVMIATDITDDNIVNNDEKEAVKPSGTAAPNSDVVLVFTDKNDITVELTVPANDQGIWDASNAPIDISNLADGDITLTATTKDEKGYESSSTKSFKKDTQTEAIIITSPSKDQLIKTTEFLIVGTAEKNADIEVKVDDKHSCTAKSDDKGDWSCSLDGLLLDTAYPITATSKDSEGNKSTSSSSFKTAPLFLEVTSPKDNSVMASSSPLILGKSLPNTKITVSAAGETCATTTDDEGNWSCNLKNLPVGQSIDMQILAAGDDDVAKKLASLKVSVPAVPLVILSPKLGETFISDTVPVSGTTDPGAKITVSTDVEGESCTAIADVQGKWSCNLPIGTVVGDKPLNIVSKLNNNPEKRDATSIKLEKADGNKSEIKTDDGVRTVLKGSGSSSPFVLLLISLGIFLIRKFSK